MQPGSPTTSGLQYRLGTSGGWSPYVIGTEISLNTDKEVQFKNTETTLSLNNNNYVKFVMTGTIEASGNIQSMLNYSETLNSCCYQNLFNGCTSLTKAPELPVTDLTNATYCYASMFYRCTKLTKAPELPATTLANYCYYNMFYQCIRLVEAPELPATTLANNCYESMFYSCWGLDEAPELPATTLTNQCYAKMFGACSGLVEAPELPATTLGYRSCYGMFNKCSSLTEAPELPATTLVTQCYISMFQDCTSLTKAPQLPATTLQWGCYSSMFNGCTSLTEAPELPATTLAKQCYSSMFNGCTSLTEAPELPATTLTEDCYYGMFRNCSNLSSIKVGFTEWNTDYTGDWVNGVSSTGTFTKLTALPEEFGVNKIPTGWTVVNSDAVEEPDEPEGELIGWRVTAVDSSKITSSFDVQDMLTYAVGEYKFDQSLVEEETLGYSYSCAGTKTYWYAPGDTMAPQEYPHLPFSANYRFLYLDYGSGSWTITFVGPMNSPICQGSVTLDPSVKYNEIDLRTVGLPLTLEPIYASTGETPADYKLQLTGSDYDGVYTMADTSATGYDRVWERTDEYGIRTCIRYVDEYSDWAICTANDNSTSNINNDSDWTPFDGFGSYENPYGNGTSGGGATLTITQ